MFGYFTQEPEAQASLYDSFTLLGSDAEGSDVSYALAAQAEVVCHERA